MSEITQRLRKNICTKGNVNISEPAEKIAKGDIASACEGSFRPGVKLSIERAKLVTESYKATEGEPMVIRRAKALKHILENMSIYIGECERIVGYVAEDRFSLITYPELYRKWLLKGFEGGYKDIITEEKKKELLECLKYWEGKCIDERVKAVLPDDIQEYVDFNGCIWGETFNQGLELSIPNYERAFKLGLNGLIKQAKDRLAELKASWKKDSLTVSDYLKRKEFLQAVVISLEAAINFARRYSALARDTAKAEKDFRRKQELEAIAEVCDRVPANPPRTLYEALQFFWFVHLISKFIENPGQGIGVRFDQLFYPYYKKDKEEGRITYEQAQELFEFLLIKCEEPGHLSSPQAAGIKLGGSIFQNLNIGGITPEGDDATNEVSFIILDAAREMRTMQPTYSLRYHDKINPDLVAKALDVVAVGFGYPAFFNDQALLPFLLERGIPREDARNYTINGCIAWNIPGKNIKSISPNWVAVSNLKCFELSLYQGVDKFTGRQLGAKTPDPLTFTRIEDFIEAYLTQWRFFMEKAVTLADVAQEVIKEHLPRPFNSAFIDGCIEQGKDCTWWAYHSYPTVLNAGVISVADSMAAIKKLVLEEKRVSLEELLEALRTNWEGREELRQMFVNEAPKFGNDDDYADLIARELQYKSAAVVREYKDSFGFSWEIDGSSAGTWYSMNIVTGATPDGRKDFAPSADGAVSPQAGYDKKGPTAVLKSTSKIDPCCAYNMLLNQKFLPHYMQGENKKVFMPYLKTWADLGHYHIQFNTIDQKTLRDAQAHPENSQNLVVRVAGYSAYFVDLTKSVQDQIITRVEQEMVA